MNDGSGTTAWSYDAAGNVLAEKRTIAGVTKTISYAYNLDGSPNSITYPGGRVISYNVGNAERPISATDSNGSQYAAGASYAPTGGLLGVIYGKVTGGFGGITEADAYNSRLEYASIQSSSTAGTALNLAFCNGTYSFAGGCSGPSTNNNGNVTGLTNSADTGRSEVAAYDPLSRIQSVQSEATSGPDCWGQSYGIDGFGNLTSVTLTQCTGQMLTVTANANNQLVSTGFAYDAAGNMTGDGSYTYTFDAENRITSANGVTYTYDGNGLRVEKSNGTLYWRALTGDAIAETDLSGNTKSEYVFFSGRRIARIDSLANVYYYYADQVGTTRTITTSSGTLCYDAEFTPYGQEMTHTNTCPQNYKFTGYERDAETGLDYAFARYYNPLLDRFMSADPLIGNLSDPQSLNRYAYVENNPQNYFDPSGMRPIIYAPVPGPIMDEFDFLLLLFSLNNTIIGWTPDTSSGCLQEGICNPTAIYYDTGVWWPFGLPDPSDSIDVDQRALTACGVARFGIITLSFNQTRPGTAGSFDGMSISGTPMNTITNSLKFNTSSLTFYAKNAGSPVPAGKQVTGFTPNANPYVTYTANDQSAAGMASTQIFELGNALGDITGVASPSLPVNTLPGAGNTEPGTPFRNCYNALAGSGQQVPVPK